MTLPEMTWQEYCSNLDRRCDAINLRLSRALEQIYVLEQKPNFVGKVKQSWTSLRNIWR